FIAAFERITDDLSRATIESYEPTEKSQIKAKRIATQYVASFDGIQSLLFSGDCGLGKSHLSFAITNALRQEGYKTPYMKLTDLFDYIKSTYKPESNINDLQILNMIEALVSLVLDCARCDYVLANDDMH